MEVKEVLEEINLILLETRKDMRQLKGKDRLKRADQLIGCKGAVSAFTLTGDINMRENEILNKNIDSLVRKLRRGVNERKKDLHIQGFKKIIIN